MALRNPLSRPVFFFEFTRPRHFQGNSLYLGTVCRAIARGMGCHRLLGTVCLVALGLEPVRPFGLAFI